MGEPPRIVSLRMRLMPYLDASGAAALEEFVREAHGAGCRVILSGVQRQAMEVLDRAGLGHASKEVIHVSNYHDALALVASVTTQIRRAP